MPSGSGFGPWAGPEPDGSRRRYTDPVPGDPRPSPLCRHAPPRRQRGWVGLVVLLVALVIVAWLAKSALTSYGLAGKPPAAAPGAPQTDPRERAKAVEQTVIEKARETARQISEGEKAD